MIELAVIDLDNTLYAADNGVFARMDVRMTDFIMRALNISKPEANALRVNYWRQYGSTLRGLMLHHGIEPESFLHDVHDIQAHELLQKNEPLNAVLSSLKMRKVIHTNGIKEHAKAVLDALGIRHHFAVIYDIRFHDYLPKPCAETLQMLLTQEGVKPEQACVVDDMEDNLKVAQQLGAKTCWVSSAAKSQRWDYHIEHIEACVCLN
ncbi:MAG: pyrimidine 5'-nucleotidase [Mariprofundaceae bacterium]|nr:pyrimidine 5'-nucleotidase [Mariprofundaceae bacterium]